MTKVFLKLKETLFLADFPNFLGQKIFFQKIWYAKLDKVFQYHVKVQRNLVIQIKKQKKPTDSSMEGQTDPISWDPPGYCQVSNKYN